MPGRFVVRRTVFAVVSSVVGSAVAFFRKGSAGVLFFCAALSTNAAPTLRIAYLDSYSPDFYVSVYAPTVQYLKKTLPQYRFESVEMTPPVTDSELTSRHPDFFFASSGAWGLFAKSQSLDLLSVRAASSDASPGPAAGSVFVVRADSDIHSVADLAGKKAAAAHAQAFSGWLTGLDRIAREGFDPKTFFSSVLFTDYGYPDILSRGGSRETPRHRQPCRKERNLCAFDRTLSRRGGGGLSDGPRRGRQRRHPGASCDARADGLGVDERPQHEGN